MKKKLLLTIVGLVLMSSTCLPTAERKSNIEDIHVKEYLEFSDSGNVIIGSKYCDESNDYKFIYQLDNDLWVASNQVWSVGSRVHLCTIKDNLNYEKK